METFATARGSAQAVEPSCLPLLERVRDLAIFVLDRRGLAASWSEGVGLLLGWSADDWLGQPLRAVYLPDEAAAGAAEAELARARDSGRIEVERWMQRRDGSRLYVHSTLLCLADEHGASGSFVQIVRDLTRARQWQEERAHLLERSAELHALTDSVRDYAIYTVNTDGRIASWHQGAALLEGYSADEAIGMPFARLFTPEDQRAGLPAQEMALAARTGEYKGGGLRVRKDGSRFEAVVVLSALRGAQGELLGFLKLTQDVTERQWLQREMDATLLRTQQARREAEQASRSKDEFLAMISHELRTPLSAILGWAHVLERGGVDAPTLRHGLQAIARNARAQAQLIEDLLDMNRLESGQLQLDLQRVALSAIAAAAIDAALPEASAKGVELRTVAGAPAGTVLGDAHRLQQVVAQLLSNAIKFTPAAGQVCLTVDEHHGALRLRVADTGQGIEPQFVPRLFERFQQQDGGSTRPHGGLGLGLAIVRRLVELHGGTVQAHSAGVGLGATFSVELPAAPPELAPALPAEPTPAPQAEARLDGVSVLLVDDEPDVRTVTQRVLRDAGAEVMLAASADEGLRLLREYHPALLLSDIGMARSDGYELIRRVRALSAAQGGQTPAAAFTAYARPGDRARVLASGFQLHLAKPVAPDALVRALARLAASTAPGRAAGTGLA